MDLPIQEVNYINPYSILVVTPKRLVRLYSPFEVQVIIPVDRLQLDQLVKVHQVQTNYEKLLVFLVDQKAYYHYHFMIIV